MNNLLLKNLEIELKKIKELKVDYQKKNEMFGESDFNTGAIVSLENAENHIKRAIARAMLPDKVRELQEWIGVLCEAYEHNNSVTWNAIAEQVVYEMFKNELVVQEDSRHDK